MSPDTISVGPDGSSGDAVAMPPAVSSGSGSRDQRILSNKHDQLSTYGLLKQHDKRTVREWIEQLCGQDLLLREGEYRVLKVSPAGRQVLRGETTPRLLKPVFRRKKCFSSTTERKT